MNFAGAGVSCADATTKTTCTIGGDLSAAVPTLTMEDITAGHDDFELYAEADQLFLVNKTTGVELLWTNGLDAWVTDRPWNFSAGRVQVPSSVTPPVPCGEGEIYYDTDATSGQRLFACQSNAWVLQGDGGGGGGGNSFETISVPAGTAPVADSATDTLTLTETSFLTITGTAGTDTIDITQVTTDLGTDGLIAANAVALTTDTTGNYVASVATSNALTGGAAGSEGAAISLDLTTSPASAATLVGTGRTLTGGTGISALGDLSADRTVTLDLTELTTATFGAGAFTTMTFDAGATDPVWTYGSGTVTLAPGGSDFIVTDDLELQGATPALTLTDTTVGSQDFELDADVGNLTISDKTDGQPLLILREDRQVALPGYASCPVLQTRADGRLVCAGGDETTIDLSANNASHPSEGFILPQAAAVEAATSDGQSAWDLDDEELVIGRGGGAQTHVGRFATCSSTTLSFSSTSRIRMGGPAFDAATLLPMAVRVTAMSANVETPPGAGNSWSVTVDGPGTVTQACACTITGASQASCSEDGATNCDEVAAALQLGSFLFTETGTAAAVGNAGACVELYARE